MCLSCINVNSDYGHVDSSSLITLFQAVAVFILYVRCTRINPADPGIMSKFDNNSKNQQSDQTGLPGGPLSCEVDNNATEAHSSPASASRSSLDGSTNRKYSAVGDVNTNISVSVGKQSSSCCSFGGFMCPLFIKEDCRKLEETDQQAGGEDALFCTLCNAEVYLLDDIMWIIAFKSSNPFFSALIK